MAKSFLVNVRAETAVSTRFGKWCWVIPRRTGRPADIGLIDDAVRTLVRVAGEAMAAVPGCRSQ
jgi:hypothetical protein